VRVAPGRFARLAPNAKEQGGARSERTTGRVLGVTLVAPNAGDAILAAVFAVKYKMTIDEMADTWAPYLAVGEGLRLAAQTFTRDVMLRSCCAS
jgi:mercuric reductase